MMRPGNIRRHSVPNNPSDTESATPDSEEAIEQELLQGTNEAASVSTTGTRYSETDSNNEDSRSQLNCTVVATRSSVDKKDDAVVKGDVVKNVVDGDASKGESRGDVVSSSSPNTPNPYATPTPTANAVIACNNGATGARTCSEAMETDSGEANIVVKVEKPSPVPKGANDSKDSGHDFDDDDDIAGVYACIAMVEEQTRANFPKTARPPGLVDCSIVSLTLII